MAAEFHDLSEQYLNSDTQYWGNLGLWQHSHDYSSACCALANELATATQLDEHTKLFDAGFGCGDQLLLWLSKYQVKSVVGVNYSHSQTQLAKKRLTDAGYDHVAQQIHYGSVNEMTLARDKVDRVIALDCAYHFPSRKQFFELSASLLGPGGRIGLTDILLADKKLSLLESLLLKTMLLLSRIPRDNIVSLTDYEAQLVTAGFKGIQIKDITEHVFVPFAQWLSLYKQQCLEEKAEKQPLLFWLKYDVTAKFLTWAYRKNILRYVIASADKVA